MQIHQFHTDRETSIVFLHGANAGGWMWEKAIQNLPEFHCLALDMPGHADSDGIEWTLPEEVAADAAMYIRNHAHGGRAHVVGLSLGGLVALHLVQQQPDTVCKLMVSGVPSTRMPKRWLVRMLGTIASPFIHSEKLLSASAKAARIPESEIAEYVRQAKRNSKRTFRRINQQAVSFSPPDAAFANKVEKVFITGEHDHPAMILALNHFAKERHARSYKVERLGHAWINQNPELFSEVVRSWIIERPMPDSVVSITS